MADTRPPVPRAALRAPRAPAPIPTRLLVAAGPFGARLGAGAVAAAIARGITAAGRPAPDVLELAAPAAGGLRAGTYLETSGFQERMLEARAVVLAWELLEQRTLAASAAFEIATRARQAGVPAYAITREDRLGAFGARMLDLQLVLLARSARGLEGAGARLGGLA